MKEVQRPNSAPFNKTATAGKNVLVESPETNQETQLPISTNSDELPPTPVKMRQFLDESNMKGHRVQNSLSNPVLEPLDKFGSFVNDEQLISTKKPKPDRIRIRLVFKNEKLNEYAKQNLEEFLVDARKDLMVHQFLSSVIEAC